MLFKKFKTTQNEQENSDKATSPNTKRKKLYIGFGGAFALLALYLLISLNYKSVYFPATVINGVNVSGLSPTQALDALNADISSYILTIAQDNEMTEQISAADIGLHIREDDTLQVILESQNILTWGLQGMLEKEYTLETDYAEADLHAALDSLSCMDKTQWVSPESAYIRYEKKAGYEIVPEVLGNEILTDQFYEALSTSVNAMESSLSLRDAGLYKLPEVTSEDASLQAQFSRLQSYSDMSITYRFGSQTEILDSDMISEWISLDKNGEITVDEEAAKQFVKDLSKKYNTAYSPKELKTSYGETITIDRGFYGWQINREEETKSLLDIIRAGKSVTREPVYLLSAASHDGPDYGNTYVEINLTAQHLFFYKDGELLIESDFVSGNPSKGNATPDGAYAITYTERNATLKGQNYRTPVSYWMPFNGNVGMHDSPWRSAFGGVIYQTNGSHGCINLPPSVAKTIFENIEKGIPVLCYYLGGTEQVPNIPTAEQVLAGSNPAEAQEPAAIPVLPENTVVPQDNSTPSVAN